MGFFEKIKLLFSDTSDVGKNHEMGDYFGDRWITLEISLWCQYTERVKVKEILKPYTKELGWKIYSIDEHNENLKFSEPVKIDNPDTTQITVNMYPSDRLTPDEFLKIKDKLLSSVYAIEKELSPAKKNKILKDFDKTININCSRSEGHEPKKSDYTLKESIGFLNIEYPFFKRVKLEKEDKEKSIKIFGKTIEEEIKPLFVDKPKTKTKSFSKKSKKDEKGDEELEESFKMMREELRKLFGFDI